MSWRSSHELRDDAETIFQRHSVLFLTVALLPWQVAESDLGTPSPVMLAPSSSQGPLPNHRGVFPLTTSHHGLRLRLAWPSLSPSPRISVIRLRAPSAHCRIRGSFGEIPWVGITKLTPLTEAPLNFPTITPHVRVIAGGIAGISPVINGGRHPTWSMLLRPARLSLLACR